MAVWAQLGAAGPVLRLRAAASWLGAARPLRQQGREVRAVFHLDRQVGAEQHCSESVWELLFAEMAASEQNRVKGVL